MKQILLMLSAAALLLAGCGKENEQIGGSGLMEADEVLVSSEAMGQIKSLRFDEGDHVTPYDTLVIIDTTKLTLNLYAANAGLAAAKASVLSSQVQVEKAQSAVTFAQKEHDRIAKLKADGTATQRQLDAIEQELEQAKLNLEGARRALATQNAQMTKMEADIELIQRQLQDCFPIAPINGTITEKYVDMGELVTPGKAMMKIARLDTLWVKLYLPTGNFGQVKLGDKATVSTESAGETYEGTVIWTSDDAEFTPKNVQTEKTRANLVYAVKLAVPNTDGKLKISMPVYITMKS